MGTVHAPGHHTLHAVCGLANGLRHHSLGQRPRCCTQDMQTGTNA